MKFPFLSQGKASCFLVDLVYVLQLKQDLYSFDNTIWFILKSGKMCISLTVYIVELQA